MSLGETSDTIIPSLPVCVPDETKELLNRMASQGLAVKYKFLRKPCIGSNKMVAVELIFENTSSSIMNGISVGSAQLQSGMKMNASVSISQLAAGGSISSTVGIDFNDTLQPAKFSICIDTGRQYPVKIAPVVGELIEAGRISESGFLALQKKLTGMHENASKTTTSASLNAIKTAILQAINVRPIDSSDSSYLRFAALTLSLIHI